MRSSSNARRIESSATLFAALGDETRLRLVSRLCEGGPTSAARLTEGSTVSRQAIAKHLRVLEGAGLVTGAREGRESVWKLSPGRLDEARAYLEAISGQWDEALGRLKDWVER